MRPKLPGLEDSWVYKLFDFFIITNGYGDDKRLRNLVPRLQLAVIPFNMIFILQTTFTAIVELQKDKFDPGKFFTAVNYGTLFCLGLTSTYTLMVRRGRAFRCFEHLHQELHCSSALVENLSWGRYLTRLKFFFPFYVLTVYTQWSLMAIVAPLFRFKVLTSETPSYIVFRLWYPVDVISSGKLFWVAYAYEALVAVNVCKSYGDWNAMMLYTLISIRVRFEALAEYFKTIITSRKKRASKEEKKGLGSEKNSRATYNNFSGAGSTGGITHSGAEMYEKGFDDWITLCRQVELASITFIPYIKGLYIVALLNNVTMAFATTYILRNKDLSISDRISECWLFFYYFINGLMQLYVPCYLGHLLKDAAGMLRSSIWQSNWTTETAEVKKRLRMFELRLSRPLTMKVFGCITVDLKSYRKGLSMSYSFFSFLRDHARRAE